MKKQKKNKRKESFISLLDFLTEIVVETVKKVNKFLTLKKTSPIVKAVIKLLLCLFLLYCFESIFSVLEILGEKVILLLTETSTEFITTIWSIFVNYSYLITSLVLLFKVINDMSKRKEYNVEIKKENDKKEARESLYTTIASILKIIISFVLIPIILLVLLLFAILGMLIYLITHGIFVVSPFLIVIGLIIIICTSLSYIYDLITLDEGGLK